MNLAICVPCKVQYRCEKNDVVVEIGGKLWFADRYKCPGCGHEVIPASRIGQTPLADLYENPAKYALIRNGHGMTPEIEIP